MNKKFEVFDHNEVSYLILKDDPDTLYHFCKNDKPQLTPGYHQTIEPFLCSMSLHKYYFHATYWNILGIVRCPWCQIIVPKELSDNFIQKKNFFNTICLECGI